MTKYFFTAIAMATVLLASCSKEEPVKPDFDDPKTISTDLRSQLSSVIILYGGEENEFEVAVDDDLCYELYYIVESAEEADFTYTTTHGVDLNLVRSDDFTFTKNGNAVKTSLVPADKSCLYIATVWKESNPDEWYPVFLPVRTREEDTKVVYSYNGSTELALERRAADVLSHPIIVDTVPKVNINCQWLDPKELIKDKELSSGKLIKSPISAVSMINSWGKVSKGSSKDDVSTHLAQQVGLSLSIPIPAIDALFNLGASKETIQDRSSSVEREWFKWNYYVTSMSASIIDDRIVNYPFLYTTDQLSDILNTVPEGRRVKYPMTLEGTMKIVDDYGVFLSLTGSFGATAQYKYERQSNISTFSLDEEAEASLGLSGYAPSSGETPAHYTIGDALMAYIKAKFHLNTTWSASLQSHFSESQKEYHQAVHASTAFFYSGGNIKTEPDVSKWSATEDPTNWNLVTFSATDGVPANVVTIYDMIADWDSDRGKLMRKALWGNPDDESTFLSEDCPYIQRIKKDIKHGVYETVVADIRMLDVDYKNSPKSTIMTGHDGVKRLYHPFIINNNGGDMTNGNGGNSLEGYGFLAGCDNDEDEKYFDFFAYGDHSKNWGDKAICIYYAMDSWSACAGIDDIVIVPNEKVKNGTFGDALQGYQMRGKSLHSVWKDANDRKMADCAIYVKYVPTESHKADYPYITAVSLVAGVRRDGTVGWYPGVPFASTLGTESYNSKSGSTDAIFQQYWNPNSAQNLYTSIVDSNTKKVYTLGVNNNVTDRNGGSSLNQYTIQSIDTYYGPTDKTKKVWWVDRVNKTTYSTNHYPALFWSYSNSDSDDKNDINACVFLNYSTSRLDAEKMSAPRTAKLLPYHND